EAALGLGLGCLRHLISANEPDVVEIIAGEHGDPLGESITHQYLCFGIKQAHFDPAYPFRLLFDDVEQHLSSLLPLCRTEVALELRIKHGSQTVEHHGGLGSAEYLTVHPAVVVGALCCSSEVAARHNDGTCAGLFREMQL